MEHVHPEIRKLASHVGMTLSMRHTWRKPVWDGKTLGLFFYNRHVRQFMPLTDHDILHEICHFMIAKDYQRDLPEYGLGSIGAFHGHHHVLLDGEEVYSDDLTVEQPVECTDGWETIKRAMHALNAVVSNGVTTDVGSPAYVASYLLKRFDSIMEHSDTWNSTEDGTENGE